ncbi:hypothetical protein D3C77_789330 [compost metagenome]
MRAAWACAIAVQGGLRTSLMVTLLIEQVELQLTGHDRVVTLGLERIDHLDQ